jgi:hypothetical protein
MCLDKKILKNEKKKIKNGKNSLAIKNIIKI